jgi:hypothetical protein
MSIQYSWIRDDLPSLEPLGFEQASLGQLIMSSYAKYCRDQAAECARRARLARSPEIVANSRSLEQRWLRLAAKAEIATVRPAGNAPVGTSPRR